MLLGFLCIALVGIVWVLVGVVMTRVAAAGVSSIVFYATGCWIAAIVSWLLFADWSILMAGLPPRAGELAGWLGVSGTFNSIGQLLLIKAMKSGHKGVSWAIVQIAMLIPFLSSVLFWGEKISWPGIAGMAALLGAIVFMAQQRSGAEFRGPGGSKFVWLCAVVGALTMIGSAQAFQAVPSYWTGWADEARLRVCLLALGGALANTIWMVLLRQKVSLPALRYGACWAVLALISYGLLFVGLDHLAAAGMSGYAFPLGQATCMIGFAFFSRFWLKEPFHWPARLGLALGLLGILLLTFC